jgi:cysteine synthase A
MHQAGQQGSIVTVLCDGGERYSQTYYNDDWLASQGFDLETARAAIAQAAEQGAQLPWPVLQTQ